MIRPLLAAIVAVLASCASAPNGAPAGFRQSVFTPRELPMDLHSRSEPNRVRVTHLDLDVTLDFGAQELRGAAELSFDRLDRSAPLLLDAQGLAIVDVVGSDGRARRWSLSAEDPLLGAALKIELAPDDTKVRIAYHTTERAAALQWLAPEQTADRTQPFLFTQGQSILTRTWIPLQDSPGVRMTYSAKVRAPAGLTVVMSAEQLGRDADGAWCFRMPQAIPPYLIALAAGDLAFESISERCGVWAERSLVHGARDELVDTEKMIQAAEELFGPYRWGRYDLIILPPSFPFGGMENPRLTFATPTILAGDKSLVALVAHELAHSWSGNLVTNATWRDFWLNEGFTVYCEQRIMEKVFGAARSDLEKELSRHELDVEMTELEPWQQVLHIDLAGKNPDDGFSGVPYEKGALFLRRLEQIWGREAFDEFLGSYFDGHAFQSITTEDFLAWLRAKLFARDLAKAKLVDLDQWLEKPGMPADAPQYDTPALGDVERECAKWVAGTPAKSLATRGWVTQQWQHFIHRLPADVSNERLVELDETFGFTRTHNCEVLCDWLVLAIRKRYLAADQRLAEFLNTVGRRKFLKPLYTELAKTPEGLARARAIYAQARPRYHAVSTATVDKLLDWKP
jgi:aminopeptidase N